MTKSVDINDIKQHAIAFGQTWQKKLKYLSESVSRSGLNGVSHWFKSHHQIEQLNEAMQELVNATQSEDFSLLLVDSTFSCFLLPYEDKGQAEWYASAANYLACFETELLENKNFDIQLLQSAINELKFISQADEFHQRYKIELIQQKVATMYQQLVKSIQEYNSIQKENITAIKAQEKEKIAKIEAEKAQADLKKAMVESIKIKEKKLAIIEEKNKLLAEKELAETHELHRRDAVELEIKQSEVTRQAKLQDDYIKLQIDEALSQLTIEDLIKLFTEKLIYSSGDDDENKKLEAFADLLITRQ